MSLEDGRPGRGMTARRTPAPMRFALVAQRSTQTNESLAGAFVDGVPLSSDKPKKPPEAEAPERSRSLTARSAPGSLLPADK